MKQISRILSIAFLCAAVAALLLHDPTFSLACCAMSGVYRLDADREY